jgi:hypothetical protein
LLQTRAVAEEAQKIVGATPAFADLRFARNTTSQSGLLTVGSRGEGDPGYSGWVLMGFVPQLHDHQRGLLAELSEDEVVSIQFASVLEDLQEETVRGRDPMRYWRDRAEREHQLEDRVISWVGEGEYEEEEVEPEEEEKVDSEDEETQIEEPEVEDPDSVEEIKEEKKEELSEDGRSDQ